MRFPSLQNPFVFQFPFAIRVIENELNPLFPLGIQQVNVGNTFNLSFFNILASIQSITQY